MNQFPNPLKKQTIINDSNLKTIRNIQYN
jgi:hypothetical protein